MPVSPKRGALNASNYRRLQRFFQFKSLPQEVIARLALDRTNWKPGQRYLDLFGSGSVELLLADRAFIGAEWLEFLCKNNIPFAIRMKEGVTLAVDGAPRSFASLL